MAAISAFDFDTPKIRIVANFAFELRGDFARRDPIALMRSRPTALAFPLVVARRWREQRHLAIEAIDDDENGPRLRRTATAQRRERALDLHSSQIGGHPDVGTEAQFRQRAAAVFAADVRDFRRRGVISVEIGKFRDFSNSRIAFVVSGPAVPVALTE